MDPITIAVVSALAAGVTTEVGKKVFGATYDKLKTLLTKKAGPESDLVSAINQLEKKPDSAGRKQTLQEEIETTAVSKDPDIVQVAQELLDQLNDQPGGAQHIQLAQGSYIAQADRGSTASVNVNQPKSKDG